MDPFLSAQLISFLDEKTMCRFGMTNKLNQKLVLKQRIMNRYGADIFRKKPDNLTDKQWFFHLKESLSKLIGEYQSDIFMIYHEKYNYSPNCVSVMKYIKEGDNKLLLWFIRQKGVFTNIGLAKLAAKGNLEILKLVTRPNQIIADAAVKSRNKELVNWIREGGFLPNKKRFEQTIHKTGDLEWIQWYCSITGWYPDLNYLTKKPKLEIYQWVYDQTKQIIKNLEAPIYYGYIDTFLWIMETFKPELTGKHIKIAVQSQNLEILTTVLKFIKIGPKEILNLICEVGSFEMLIWHFNKFRIRPTQARANLATVQANFKMVVWMGSNFNIYPDLSKIAYYNQEEHFSIIEWLWQKKGPDFIKPVNKYRCHYRLKRWLENL